MDKVPRVSRQEIDDTFDVISNKYADEWKDGTDPQVVPIRRPKGSTPRPVKKYPRKRGR